MPSRAKITSVEDAYEAAMRMVTRKARTCTEVRAALSERGVDSDSIESVIGKMKAHRFLDDAVLADDEAAAYIESKGMSLELAVYRLTERGIAQSVARASIDAAIDGRSEWKLCERALGRRLKGKRLAEKNAGREARALSRLGYEEEVVARVIERALRGSGT